MRSNFTITEWFVEQQTAAKEGRPIWSAMLKGLRQGTAQGVIIHKIDRSARNLKDWNELGELIDRGIEVHFVNQSLDMHSSGGRLSADLQAVVAVHYSRNLREEAKKGIYGRLKQGFYPLRAPIGYLDNGSAKPKTIDPVKGPLVRKAFDLYATGRWSIPTLVDELYRQGLRNHSGGRVTRNGIHTILRGRFYTGVIHIRASGQTFEGNHEALISKSLYDRVQNILHGRVGTRVKTHDFLFRRFIRCVNCGNALIGELQKGHVYYRCHTRACPTTNIREEMATAAITDGLKALCFNERERAYLELRIAELNTAWIGNLEQEIQGIKLKIEQVTERLNRTTDAYLEGVLEREMFDERKALLVQERRALVDRHADFETNRASVPGELRKFVELAKSANSLYQNASTEKKRRLLRIVMSNCTINAKKVDLTWQIPFRQVAEREKDSDGRASREIPRTLGRLFDQLLELFSKQPEINLALDDE